MWKDNFITRLINESLSHIMKKIRKKIKQPSDSVSFISGEYKIFQEIEKETLERNRENADILVEHLNNWIDSVIPIIKNNPELSRSLIGVRFIGTFSEMRLTVFSILSGCYFQSVRNLRFVFESMIHAYYLETEYAGIFPDLFLEVIDQSDNTIEFQRRLEARLHEEYPKKKDRFRDITGFSSTIIDSLPLLSAEKDHLKITYHKLSSLVHPAPEQIKKIIENPDMIFTFFYNEEFFKECAVLTDEVMDLTFAIVLCRFPEVKENIKTNKNALLNISLVRLPITNRLLNN